MMKKLVVLLACLGALHLSSCTSNDAKSDADVTSDFDSADLEKLDGEDSLDTAGLDSSLGSDSLPEDALGETTSTTTVETTITEEAPAPEMSTEVATSESLPADPFAESVESTPPPMESSVAESSLPPEPAFTESTQTETTTSTTTYVDETDEKPKKKPASLQKVATAPWKVGKVWYNTVYFARPGDSLSSISKMIYGKNKSAELKKGNTILQSRGVKPGDKIYYNSPHRPDDSGRLLTFYEDNGIAPETYIAKEGDNIRDVSKDLLGYKDAWKEVWSSNSVDSKGAIAAGTELRYWKGGHVAAAPAAPPEVPDVHQEIAAAPPADMGHPMEHMPPPADIPPPPTSADMDMPPPPPSDMPMEMAPPPPPPDMMAQEMAPPPPPPPPVEAVNPPAPHQEVASDEAAPGMDNDTTLALAVVGLAAAGLAILIVMRKKRKQRELEQQIDNTHVG